MNNFVFRNKIEVVLVDWHGIIGKRGFWCNQSKKNEALGKWCDEIFTDCILKDWMKDKVSFDQLCKLGLDKYSLTKKEIVSSFVKDIGEYGPNWELLFVIDELFPNSKKILFSDNPLIFRENILKHNRDLQDYFDEVILSCDYGVLKEDEVPNLFDVALIKLELNNFNNVVLIDDNAGNCEQFKKRGGHIININ